MTINFQPTSTSSPLDGSLLVKPQSRDLEAPQSSSFSEVFKDEEKKLQKEQETSAFSVAAVLAANPTLSIIEATPLLNATIGSDKGNSDKQSVLQSKSDAANLTGLMPVVEQNSQGKTVAGEEMAKAEINTSMPISEIPQSAVKVIDNVKIPSVTKVIPGLEPKVEKTGLSTIGLMEIPSEKLEAEIKPIEMHPQVVLPALETSSTTMVGIDDQSDIPGIPTAVRLEVAGENPVWEAKIVPVGTHTATPTPATIDKATPTPVTLNTTAPALATTDVSKPELGNQNEKINMPGVLGAQVASIKTDVEGNKFELQSRVLASNISNEALSTPEIQSKKINLPAPGRAEIVGEKTVVETNTIEAQLHVVTPAQVVFDKVAVTPEVQSEKTSPPMPVDVQVAIVKPVEETNTVDMHSLISSLGTFERATAVSGITNDKPGNSTIFGAQVTGEPPVTEVKAGIQQSAKGIDVETKVPDATMAVPDSRLQSEKTSVVAESEESGQKIDPITFTASTIKEAGEVKTAEKLTTSQVNIQSSEVAQQIMSQMKVRIKSGASSMRLQLNPKELGGIEVQMIRNTEGVSVTFFAEHASTGHLLETQINQLRQSLKDAGVQLTGLNISQQNQPKQEGGFFKQRPFLGQYFQDDSPQIETANKEWEHRERIGGSLNEVDYLI